ncbi:MAG: hypothetical protein V4524_02305 [Patescibacteria group bacterium]
MRIFYLLYETIIEALFPLSETEKELFSYSVADISKTLPPAPSYSGLAVPLPESGSLFAYKDKRVEQLVWNIKYKKSAQAVKLAGYSLFEYINKQPTDMACLILPMPITKQRRRERGYNQCELLTNEMRRLCLEHETNNKLDDTCAARFIFENNLLIRTHHDGRHTLKGRADRVESAKGIFGVDEKILNKLSIEFNKSGKEPLTQVKVIIIDDVITTGSTMREAIDTMKKSGFVNVSGLSVAH